MQNENFSRPDIGAVYNLLHKHDALIVHFSGAPKGAGIQRKNHLYPNDLACVLAGQAITGLSSSTVMPDDVFHGSGRNATGCIGVILGFKNSHSLIDAHEYDCGSMLDESGNRITQEPRNITITELERTILGRDRGSYNEWVVCEYLVLGIFAVDPLDISYLSAPLNHPDMPDYLQSTELEANIRQITLQEVANDFKEQPIYTFWQSNICRVTSGGFVPISHQEIYKFNQAGLQNI